MKLFAGFVIALFLALPLARAQESPDDQYVIIYTLIEQGDTSVNNGEPQQALGDYSEAQRELQKFQQVYGDWNPTIVNYRLKYLAEKIAELTPQTASTPPTNAAPPVVQNPAPAPVDWQSQITSLNQQIRQLQSDDATLQAKLKEALSVQPATVSADAFAQMQEQVRELTKENDLLKATANLATNNAPQNLQLQQSLASETARADQLARENQSLQSRMQTLTTDATAAEALREENAVLKKELATAGANGANDLNERASQLARQNQSLLAQVNLLKADAQDAEALREENAVLKKELANKSLPNSTGNGTDLAMARRQMAQYQADAAADWLEKTALENRIKAWQENAVSSASPAAVAGTDDLQAQIRELKLERDNLLAELGEANKKIYGIKNQGAAAQIDALAQQVETLRARIAVDESQPVPFSPQELALLAPGPVTPNPNAEKKSIHELPGGAAVLVAEAQNYYNNREYSRAAADYQEILKRDQTNPLALANLAAIELEEDHLADADKHIQAAITETPDDPFDLTILGRVEFSEGKYDDALNALDRAAKFDPQNPQIQNFLGVALAEKGLRSQAETAFRKAILIRPDYADAHKNLAIIYLSATPPLVELARWHYEKALAAGMPPSPDFEKMLNANGATASQ